MDETGEHRACREMIHSRIPQEMLLFRSLPESLEGLVDHKSRSKTRMRMRMLILLDLCLDLSQSSVFLRMALSSTKKAVKFARPISCNAFGSRLWDDK